VGKKASVAGSVVAGFPSPAEQEAVGTDPGAGNS
jgi:hypothetical protein